MKWINTQGKGPVRKAKVGRFEVSIWKWVKIVPPSEDDSFSPEQQFEVERACLRYNTWNRNNRTWNECAIWCNIDELRDLAHVLDDLNFKDNP